MSFIDLIKKGIDTSKRVRLIAWLATQIRPFADKNDDGKIDVEEVTQAVSQIIPDPLEKHFGVDKILKALPHFVKGFQELF